MILSIMTFGITILVIITLIKMSLSLMTFSIVTLSITTHNKISIRRHSV